MRLFSFRRGGIHPKGGKPAAMLPITNAHLPHYVIIPMSMHVGESAKCLVKPGDVVREGDRIGEAVGLISSHVHASVPGRVTAVQKLDLVHAKGVECVRIETGGNIRNWYAEKRDWKKLDNAKILEAIREAGVVGLGGACFPTHVKLSPPPGCEIKDLLVNIAECEPYLSADYRLVLERPEDLLEGVRIARKLLGNPQAHLCIEDSQSDLIELFGSLLQDESGIVVAPLRSVYPQGSEKLLAQAVLRREVPSGKLPPVAGFVAQNAATLVAVMEAVVYGKPLIDRVLTFSGAGVKEPGNYKVRIGTPIRHLAQDHGLPSKYAVLVAGGPMMGRSTEDQDVPVVKAMNGITVLRKKDDYRVKNQPCIRCARCVDVCPTGLEPTTLSKLCEAMRVEEAVSEYGLLNCIECGNCAYACPSTIPIVGQIRWGKSFWTRQQVRAKSS